jgi:hypothetical protein
MVKPVPMVKIVEPAIADKFWLYGSWRRYDSWRLRGWWIGGAPFRLGKIAHPSGQKDKPVDSRE